jgi:hypothetical protein
LVAKKREQTVKPLPGLGRKSVALAGVAQEHVEAVNMTIRPAFFVRKSVTFGTPNFSLN